MSELPVLCIHGTIPVNYVEALHHHTPVGHELPKGDFYNVPITLWLDRKLPAIDPIVFVAPIFEQKIASEYSYLDRFGKVSTHEWTKVSAERTIVGLLRYIQQVFQKQPPLYAKAEEELTEKAQLSSRIKSGSRIKIVTDAVVQPRNRKQKKKKPLQGTVVCAHEHYCEVEMDDIQE